MTSILLAIGLLLLILCVCSADPPEVPDAQTGSLYPFIRATADVSPLHMGSGSPQGVGVRRVAMEDVGLDLPELAPAVREAFPDAQRLPGRPFHDVHRDPQVGQN